MNKRSDNGHGSRVINFIRVHDLLAVDIMCRPTRRYMFGQDKRMRICNASYLQKDTDLRPKKLDYFLVSNRWRSCVINSKTNWAPAVHLFGKTFDHSLIKITWKWRVKSEKTPLTKDFKGMQAEDWKKFNSHLARHLQEPQAMPPQDPCKNSQIEERLSRMNSCIRKTIEEWMRTEQEAVARRKTRDLWRHKEGVRGTRR